MEYNKEDNTYTESHREGELITIYYKDNEIILKNEYNILIDKHNISVKNAFNKCDFNKCDFCYITDLYFQLDEHLGRFRSFYKDLRSSDKDNRLLEYERIKNKYNISRLFSNLYLDDMLINDPIIYFEYSINECTKSRQRQLKDRMERAKNRALGLPVRQINYDCSSESESSDNE
jgi:hypothetical protein